MLKLETLLDDGLRSELMFHQQLEALSLALRQQLQETGMRQREELEKRMNQNALLSTVQESNDKNEMDRQAKHAGMKSSNKASSLSPDKRTLHQPRQSERIDSSFSAWLSSSNQKHYSDRTSTLASTRTRQCEPALASSKTTEMRKEEEAEAECQKKFSALPVPSHVIQPLYQKMMDLREKERKQSHEQRREFLLSIQKPFSFQEREKEKKEKLTQTLNHISPDHTNKNATVRKPPHKEVKDLPDTSELKAVTTVRHKSSTVSGSPKLRTAERTRKEKLGFLYERPSFQPKIIHQVPDFSRLHKALQTDQLRKTYSKDTIKCQPFYLRTSVLPARQRRMSPENSQVPQISKLSRSKSLGALTSLSTDTLPVYITDAVRKRCITVRKSIEMRDNKNQETEDWLRTYQMRSQAMKKTITLHAKLLDPHRSLKEVHNEKLQHHRAADQQRMREYMRELRDMKARVIERPYLFEQVKQKNAKVNAEQIYRRKLRKVGVKEQFVEEIGEATGGSSTPSGSDDNIDKNDISSREENVDGWEKIEDVEEKSVKSRGEEMS